IVIVVWAHIYKVTNTNRGVQKLALFIRLCIITDRLIANAAAVCPLFPDAKINRYSNANLIVKNIATFSPSPFATCPRVALEIDNPNLVKLFCNQLAKAVIGAAIDKRRVTHKRNDAVLVHAIRSPAKEARIHVVELSLLRG